jgi:hypothetical protein
MQQPEHLPREGDRQPAPTGASFCGCSTSLPVVTVTRIVERIVL